jgi:acyl carrier protein
MKQDELVALVSTAVKEVLAMKDGAPATPVDASTVLFGAKSAIDSLDLVNVIVRLEDALLERTGKQLTIVDEQSVVTADSPFRTVGSLAQLAAKRLDAS